MSAARLEIDLDRIRHNARTLVERLAVRNISVTGITKAALGSADIGNAMISAGVSGLGDSRIENIEAMRRANVIGSMTLIRSPMPSQVARVVAHADVSFNTELGVIKALSRAARDAKRTHTVVLMVELGDLREGIMPADLDDMVRAVLRLPNVILGGIGANLACHGGVTPDVANMSSLSTLAESLERHFGMRIALVTGGNSANLDWALGGTDTGRINNLRLGESILLGCDPLHRRPIDGLHTDAITLVAEVIESKVKPSKPWGVIGQTAFGDAALAEDRGETLRALLAIGCQDIDPAGLQAPPGIRILGASGDHLVIDCGENDVDVGAEMRFGLNYSALIRAMTSPFVAKVTKSSAYTRPRAYRIH